LKAESATARLVVAELGLPSAGSNARVDTAAANGGGISNFGTGAPTTLTLTDSSSVTRNTASYAGGIDNDGTTYSASATVTLTDSSSVTRNTATRKLGGGIFNTVGSGVGLINCIPGLGGNVYGNTPDDISG
jgi:hypothetical protein